VGAFHASDHTVNGVVDFEDGGIFAPSAVRIAASLSRLAKSAPVKPGYVWRPLLMTHSVKFLVAGVDV